MISEQQSDQIADALENDGYIILDQVLPEALVDELALVARSLKDTGYKAAGIGRDQSSQRNASIRNDEIAWLDPMHPVSKLYLEWMEQLRLALNRRLFLGLFDYESHYAHYAPGAYYRKHLDAFKGNTSRVVTTVFYLNKNWEVDSQGELIIYSPDNENMLEKVTPVSGRLVIFLSKMFPHEVLPATKDRYSIAGWFRINNSTSTKVDPA
jgi:SM-20-related protein